MFNCIYVDLVNFCGVTIGSFKFKPKNYADWGTEVLSLIAEQGWKIGDGDKISFEESWSEEYEG